MSAEVLPLRTPEQPEPLLIPRRESRYVLLTVAEAAPLLFKTEAQLRWMLHVGTAPPSAMVGGRRMFRLSDIEDHIDRLFAEAAAAE